MIMIDNETENYQIYYDLGRELAKEEKWREAIAVYQKALKLKDDLAEIYHHLGDSLLNLRKWHEAINAYSQALKININLTWSHHNLGVALFSLGQKQEAIKAYEKAISLNEENPQFHYSLGKALSAIENLSLAAESYQLAISLGWKKPRVYHELGDIFSELQRWDEAIGAYQLAIKLDSQLTWSYHNLGKALLQLKLPQEATTFFEQAIAIDTNFVSAYFHLGEAFRLLEKWDNAVSVYRQAIILNPEFPNLQVTLADTLQQRAKSDLESALANYDQILAIEENQSFIAHKIAVILVEKQQLDVALYYIGFALKLEPENTDYLALYNTVCQQRSKLYEPVKEFIFADHSYSLWCKNNLPSVADLRLACLNLREIKNKPVISIILPLEESAIEWIEDTIATIQNQVYPHWQLCIATATVNQDEKQYWQETSKLSTLIESYRKSDRRIKHFSGEQYWEMAHLANQALNAATGEWIAILQPKTLLTPDALLQLVEEIGKDDTADIFYGDEDCLKQGNLLTKPYFKPQWCPDLLLTSNYFGSLVLCRHALVKEVAGFKEGYGNAYHYDLLIRLTEKTTRINHVARILCHRQQLAYSATKTTKVITDALKRRGETATVISHSEFPEIKTIRYEITQHHLVSIIIPTRNLGKMLDRCLTSIFQFTTYDRYEVILLDNGSDEPETLEIITQWQVKEPKRLKTIRLDIPFNYSRLNNQAVTQSQGEYLLFLNNDTEIISADWLEAMIEQAQRSSIGAVGALLLYPDETIQHAGVVLGVTGVAGHGHRYYSINDTGYNYALLSTTNYSAVTGACLMCRREVFDQVGGFNEQLAVAYNDVDFCLKLQQQGYNNIWLPHVKLYHAESQSRTVEDTPAKQQRILQEVTYMQNTWGKILQNDPCYNRHLTREKEDFSLNLSSYGEVKAIFLTEASQAELYSFFLDRPKLGAITGNSLDIVGWVIGKVASAISLSVICHGEVISQTEIDRHRPDVALAYPQFPEAINSGFAISIELTNLPIQAELILAVMLANKSQVKLCKIIL